MGGFFWCGRCHGIDNDRGFLSLEFVDGPNLDVWNAVCQVEHLGVIGADDQNITGHQWTRVAFHVDPPDFRLQQLLNNPADEFGFFIRSVVIAVVVGRDKP